ncbi:hypothetical protein [Ruegeria atlantica]|uniref:hypothetical protein n=1 Tax=Ruegeria atlantica TaxID=81569 RepID=UPI0014811F9A|nr:hypothetical protein [Ruegeria atlantica]
MAFWIKTRSSLLRQSNPFWRAILLSLALLAPSGLAASTVSNALPSAELRGSATFRYLGLPIYDAKLFTAGGAPFRWSEDFGLQLTYRKNIKQKALIESTLDEMKRQGNSGLTQANLGQCFEAVSKGDVYLAVSDGPNKVGFWLNGRKTCNLTGQGIKKTFMSIFLGDNTRSASFTRQLKGQ